MRTLRVALAQLNTTVGDLAGNSERILEYAARGAEAGADLIAFPELAITGYPPEDLLIRSAFIEAAGAALEDLARRASDLPPLIVGCIEFDRQLYNSAAIVHRGRVAGMYRKHFLPNYGVFDEYRYFQPGEAAPIFVIGGVEVGVTVCEDLWFPDGPMRAEALAGARVVVNINASPFHGGKPQSRERMVATRAADNTVAVAWVNQVGGQDELVFDGYSFVVDHTGAVIARAPQFEEALTICSVDITAAGAARLRDTRQRAAAYEATDEVERLGAFLTARPGYEADPPSGALAPPLDAEAEVYGALVLGTRDYVRKNGFKHVVLGLSGGVDSALVACIAVDALGPDAVTCVTMPSRYTSAGTFTDAGEIARRLGVKLLELPIADVMAAYEAQLAEPFAGTEPDLTEENLQARIRGNDLMALSNKFGHLVLTTGNKSEMSVGYSTLYGDSAGGFAVIKDVPKTLVYRLAEWRTAQPDAPIPETVITRPPSAELRPDQTDQDSLPPYEILDPILEGYVEQDLGREQLIARGFDADVVDRIIRLVDLAEYKRRQQPPGIKVTSKAFGRDRRMPITNGYRG